MAKAADSDRDWLHLYEAAIRLKEVAPWTWMVETDVFGVQNPETGDLGFVSVMGMRGEHFAVSLYLGAKGLYGFWDFEEIGEFGPPERLLEIPQLQASFEDRDELQTQDRTVIKNLGLKFRGKKAWPMFRSFRAGFLPWHLEAGEVRFLTYALDQLAEVAPRFKENPDLFDSYDAEQYLVRVPKSKDASSWEDRAMTVLLPEPKPIKLLMDPQLLAHLKQIKLKNSKFEIDLCMFPAPMREKGDRPYFAYILLIVDVQSGMILCHEMFQPLPSLEEMWGKVPLTVAQTLASASLVPKEIAVSSELVFQLLEPLAKSLNIKLKAVPFLPALSQVQEFMFARF
ncbi:DUF6930 domain-containing protein [Altericista sp. CCNU0014]|uniref:DUF7309 domain-containing protein n=1 Tax=Altericista sp. CCNU0014 TaxID=3082949 RepID=UPI00384DCB58